jgi:hypothetical protein
VVILLERAYVSRMLAMGEHDEDERFTWFRPPERNTIRPRKNESCIAVCCLSIGLTLGCPGFSLSILTSVAAFYSSRLHRLHCDIEPRHVALGWLDSYTVGAP